MIVHPDFLDHWKTQMLCDLLRDPCAPLYVIRLWAHCQNRKTHRLPLDKPEAIKAICRAPQDAKTFHSAMITAGFLRQDDHGIYAHEWADVNASLISSWSNGKKGGRPKKKTQTKPKHNPDQTQSEPIREEKSRVEKNRVEKNRPATENQQRLLSIYPEYDQIQKSKVLKKITLERYARIASDFPNVNRAGVVKLACLKADDPDAKISKPDPWLVAQFKHAPDKPKHSPLIIIEEMP